MSHTQPSRILLAHGDQESRQQLYDILCTRQYSRDGERTPETVSQTGDVPPPSGGFDVSVADGTRQAISMVAAAIDAGAPFAAVVLDSRQSDIWDGLDCLQRMWRVDPHLEIGLCLPPGESWDAAMNVARDSDQVLFLETPYREPIVSQAAHMLTRKWHLARRQIERQSEIQQRLAAHSDEFESTREQLDRQVADRARLESDLRRAQRVEGLARLAAGLGHEINNPLSFMISGAEGALAELAVAEARFPDYSFQTLRELLEPIVVGADRISQIIKNVKLLAHQAEITAEAVALPSVVEVALKLISPSLGDHMDVTTDLGEVAPIWCKRVELEQVFTNILQNSIQALGDVRGRRGRIHIASRRQGQDQALVAITDNGCGIREDLLDKVFEPFFTTKPAGIGTGLGLSICHGIITGLGGQIDIDSKVGRGTTVTIRIPCLLVQVEDITRQLDSAPARTSAVGSGVRGRVLVVDDEALIRKVVSHALHEHDVVTAINGREALALCHEQTFDVILCDIMMPEVNGVEFYRQLSENTPGAEDDIIFFSGGTQIQEIQAFLERIPNDCLEKPVQRRPLQQRIKEYVHLKRQLNAARGHRAGVADVSRVRGANGQ